MNNAFRRANRRLSITDPISIKTTLLNASMNEALKANLDINITERETGRGVPLAPYSVYLDGIELTSGRCDKEGHAVEPLVLPTRKNEIDTYHGRRRLITASSHHTVRWDNFNDNELDKKIWDTFSGTPAYYVGQAKTTEKNKRLEFLCSNTGYLAGVYTKSPIDLSDSRIRVRLYSDGFVVCALTILPSTEPFYGASYNKGYDVMIWRDGLDKFIVYSGKLAFTKDTIRGNPETIEVVIEGDTIKFLEEGVQVYSEKYKPASKLCNIRLWGQSWYHFRGGTSWVDDFLVVGG